MARLEIGVLIMFWAPAGALAQEIEAFSDTVRFDLEKGTLIGASVEAPLDVLRLTAPLSLIAAKDEVVAFQFLIRGAEVVLPVAAKIEGGIRAELFQARGIKTPRPSESMFITSLGPGVYPDPLVPTATIAIPKAPGVAVLWVDLWVPPETKSGAHRGVVTVGDRTVDLSINVANVTLSKRDVARIGAVSFGSMRALEKTNLPRQRQWMQLAHAHRMTIEVMGAWPEGATPRSVDWTAWSEVYGPYLDGSAFSEKHGYFGPRSGAPIPRFIIPLSDNWPLARTEAKLPNDPAAWSAHLAAWEKLAIEKGWFAGTDWILFINSLDEPKTKEALESLVKWKKLIDDAKLSDRRHLWFRIDGPFSQGVAEWPDERILEELGEVVDIWNVCGATPWIPWRLLEKRRYEETGEKLMFYASNTSGEPATPPIVLDVPLTNARAWGWIIRAYGLDGALNWEIDFAAGCVENPRCYDPNLNADANLIYRGHEVGRSFYEPIPSMRLKALRRGAQDVALLELLAAQDPDTAQAIADVIVPRAMGDDQPPTGPGMWPKRSDELEKARISILERLDKDLGKAPSMADIRPEIVPDPLVRAGPLVLITGGVVLVGLVLLSLRRRSGRPED